MDGKIVIVTGGAGLLGTEYCRSLAEVGAIPVVADVDGLAAERVAEELSGLGSTALPIQVDVADPASVRAMVDRVTSEFGRVDALVNNAAIDPKFETSDAGRHSTAFEEYPVELFNRSLAVNVSGAFLCAQAVAAPMLAQGRGSIVNISSIYGMVGPDQRIYEKKDQAQPSYKPPDYSVTKSALFGLTRYLAAYWGPKNIRVNSLTLGGVFNDHDEEFTKAYSARVPLGRMAKRDEYSQAVLFLLSDASTYMTGANMVVDGGWTAW